MAVEDPHAVPHDPRRRVDPDFPREMPDEPDVVVPRNEVDAQPPGEEPGEEVEDHRAERRRRPNDRMLDVPRHEHPARVLVMGQLGEECLQPLRGAFGRSRPERRECPQAPGAGRQPRGSRAVDPRPV